MEIKIFETPELLAESFAEYFSLAYSKKKPYNIALSGGSTPKIIFKVLAENYSESINWENIHFYWGDERCVPPDSDESNYGTAKKILFDNIKIPEFNIHRIRGEEEPLPEAERYASEILKNLPLKNNLPCFDFIILGLGEDGHTASIFPDRLDLFQSDKICEAVEHPISHQRRITICGKVLNNCENAAFFVTGKEKSNVVKNILENNKDISKFPASYINPQHGFLFWYLDNAGSSKL